MNNYTRLTNQKQRLRALEVHDVDRKAASADLRAVPRAGHGAGGGGLGVLQGVAAHALHPVLHSRERRPPVAAHLDTLRARHVLLSGDPIAQDARLVRIRVARACAHLHAVSE